jgi:hypothetical protein
MSLSLLLAFPLVSQPKALRLGECHTNPDILYPGFGRFPRTHSAWDKSDNRLNQVHICRMFVLPRQWALDLSVSRMGHRWHLGWSLSKASRNSHSITLKSKKVVQNQWHLSYGFLLTTQEFTYSIDTYWRSTSRPRLWGFRAHDCPGAKR